jgi:hypothetical protein
MDIIKLIDEGGIFQIRSKSHPNYVGISIISVNGRIFARAGRIGENSWYECVLKDQKGEIKINKQIFQVKALVPKDIKKMTPKINTLYNKKYPSLHKKRKFISNIQLSIHFILKFITIRKIRED